MQLAAARGANPPGRQLTCHDRRCRARHQHHVREFGPALFLGVSSSPPRMAGFLPGCSAILFVSANGYRHYAPTPTGPNLLQLRASSPRITPAWTGISPAGTGISPAGTAPTPPWTPSGGTSDA